MNLEDLKTFEDACKVLGIDSEKVIPTFEFYPERDRKAMIAHAKLVIIVRAANKLENGGEEWILDYSNYDQYKYEPWFYMNTGSSGSEFSYDGCGDWSAVSGCGSRLCFISRKACEFITKEFLHLYEEFFLIN